MKRLSNLRATLPTLVAVIALGGAHAARASTDGLIGYWAFDESSGSAAGDSSTTGNDGTLRQGPVWASGYDGNALLFDGSDDYVEIPHNAAYLADEGTVSIRFNVENSSWDQFLFSKDATYFGTGGHISIYLEWETVVARIQDASGGTYEIRSPIEIVPGEWYQVVVTWGSNGFRLYLDGVELATNAYTGGLGTSSGGAGNTEPIYIGAARWNADPGASGDDEDHFDGLIDDVQIYDRALSGEEIAGPSELVGHWKLDETGGLVAADSTSNANDGTLYNSPTWTTGADGGALEFDGTNDCFLEVPHIDAYLINSGTVSFWLKTNDLTGQRMVFSKDAANNGTGGHFSIYLEDDTFRVRLQSPGSSYEVTFSSAIVADTWHHVVVTWGNGGLQCYLDGANVGSDAYLGGWGNLSGGIGNFEVLAIGAGRQNTTAGDSGLGSVHAEFEGLMDDIRIYKGVVSVDETLSTGGLVGHWKLDENTGTTLEDVSLRGNDASFDDGSPTWTTGVRGYALDFDGSDDAETQSDFEPPAIASIAFWMRSNAMPTARERILGIANDWEFKTGSDGVIYCDLEGLGSGDSFTTGTSVLEPGKWQHVVAIYNTVDDTHQLYIDNELVSSGAFDCEPHPAGVLSFGTRTGNSQRFNGALDDIRIYDYELSAAEVSELYGLVGHWKLDETSGTTAADSSPLEADGEHINSPTVGQSAVRLYGVDFDGSNDYVRLQSNTAHDCREELSVAAWIKADSFVNYAAIFNRGHYSHSTFGLRVRSDGSLDFQGGQGTIPERTAPGIGFLSTRKLTADRWHHVAAVWDGTTVSLYIDGEFDSSTAFSGDLGVTTELSQIGADLTGGDEHFDGLIDDVVLYNRAMTTEEIAEHYGLVGYWKLDETSGTTAADSSVFGHDAEHEAVSVLGQAAIRGVGAKGLAEADSTPTLDAVGEGDGDHAVALWVKADELPGYRASIFRLSTSSRSGPNVAMHADGRFALFATTSGGTEGTNSTGFNAEAGRWHQVVAQKRGSALEIYIDGELNRTDALSAAGINASGQTVTIGRQEGSGGDPHFTIDDVKLYNRAMTPKEIAEHYGLLAHYKLDESSGTTANDSGPFANHTNNAANTPVAGVEGPRGTAFDFTSGGSSRVIAPETPELAALGEDNGDFAVALWAKPATTGSGYRSIYTYGETNKHGMPRIMVQGNTNRIQTVISRTDTWHANVWSNDGLPTDKWTQVVVQKKGSLIEIYLDGERDRSTTWSVPTVGYDGGSLNIGGQHGYASAGAVDDVVVYNRAMTPQEIAEHYGLIGHWRMEDGSGSVVSDSSGMGNDGAFVGTSAWSTDCKEASGALQLDGTNYVELPSLLVDGSTGATIAGWGKLTASDTGGSELISLGDHLLIRLDPYGGTTNVHWYEGAGWGTYDVGVTHGGAGWTHFAAVYNADTLELSVYVDGVLHGVSALSAPIEFTGLGATTRFGQHADGQTDRNFTGFLDDLRVYNRPITASEARALYYGAVISGVRITRWVEVANP